MKFFVPALMVTIGLEAQGIPTDLTKVISQFQMAAKANDIAQLETLVTFPLEHNWGTPIANPAEFEQLFPKIFTKERIDGLNWKKPYSLKTGWRIYSYNPNQHFALIFRKTTDGYKLWGVLEH